jgi:hypothetical protein
MIVLHLEKLSKAPILQGIMGGVDGGRSLHSSPFRRNIDLLYFGI